MSFTDQTKKNCIATTATVASLPLLVSCLLGGVGRVGVVWVGGYRQLQQAPLETAPKKYINPNTPTFQVTSWVKDEKWKKEISKSRLNRQLAVCCGQQTFTAISSPLFELFGCKKRHLVTMVQTQGALVQTLGHGPWSPSQ